MDDTILVELKSHKELLPQHEAQLLHYLKATQTKVGLLLNFGPERCTFKRMVM
ncbi:MAG: hypothetical protein Fur0018_04540 [Anaerolineales bacterium]